jgi:hypothetical protein
MTNLHHFSNYLKSLRLKRGYEYITEYLKAYHLSISESYYRNLEAGRNLATLEKAELLRTGLQADRNDYYSALLLDILPDSIAQLVLQSEHQTKQSCHSSETDDNNQLKKQASINYLRKNPALIPVIDLIYAHDYESGITLEKLGRFLKNNGITCSIQKLSTTLVELDIVQGIYTAQDQLSGLRKVHRQIRWNDQPLDYLWFQNAIDTCWTRYLPQLPRYPELNLRYFSLSHPLTKEAFISLKSILDDTFKHLQDYENASQYEFDFEPFLLGASIAPDYEDS